MCIYRYMCGVRYMTATEEKKKKKEAVGKALQEERTGYAKPKSLGLPHSQEWPGTLGGLTRTRTDRIRDGNLQRSVLLWAGNTCPGKSSTASSWSCDRKRSR